MISKKDFIEMVKRDCREYGVRYYLPRYQKVHCDAKSKVGGYFDGGDGTKKRPPVLACATGKKGWIEILIHESCHMDQWRENTPLWRSTKGDIFDEWLSGKDYPPRKVEEAIRHIQELELDCEKRSVKKIKKLGLDVDVVMYTKKANAYVLFYTVMMHTRKWCKVAPYKVPEIVNMMPDRFMTNYTKISPELMRLYEEKCY